MSLCYNGVDKHSKHGNLTQKAKLILMCRPPFYVLMYADVHPPNRIVTALHKSNLLCCALCRQDGGYSWGGKGHFGPWLLPSSLAPD